MAREFVKITGALLIHTVLTTGGVVRLTLNEPANFMVGQKEKKKEPEPPVEKEKRRDRDRGGDKKGEEKKKGKNN
jgi:hypothetical protein